MNFKWDSKTLRRNGMLALALIILILGVHEIFGEHGYLALRRQKQHYQMLQQQIQQLQKQNHQLEQKVQSLKTDPQVIERQARDKLHLVKPGEIIYTLPSKTAPQNPSDAQNLHQSK